MLLHPQFGFIEMPRTASTHVVRLLRDLPGVERVGQHQPAPPEIARSGRPFFATIRNPWDWYVSQWTIGCGRTGTLYAIATRDARRVDAGPAVGATFDPTPWRRVYSDRSARDVGLFRDWLRLLFDPEATATALPRAFGRSDLRLYAGWYSYMYLKLFCGDLDFLHRTGALPNAQSMELQVNKRRYVSLFARTENLGRELVAVLDEVEFPMDAGSRAALAAAPPSNQSHRALRLDAYYDEPTRNLVADRDELILRLHYPERSPTAPFDGTSMV
jgi:hypothetical protein